MSNFKKLVVWQKAHELATLVEALAQRIARSQPRLADQLARAAWAVPAAIAEGSGRGTDRDFANYCSTAIGEVSEVENHLQRGLDVGVVYRTEHEDLTDRAIAVRRKLIGLRRTLRGQPRPEKPPEPPTRDLGTDTQSPSL